MTSLNDYINVILKNHFKFKENYKIDQILKIDIFHIKISTVYESILCQKLKNMETYQKFYESINNIIKQKLKHFDNLKIIIKEQKIHITFKYKISTYFDNIPEDCWYEIIKYLDQYEICNLGIVIPINYQSVFRLWYPQYVKHLLEIKNDLLEYHQNNLKWKYIFNAFETYLERFPEELFDKDGYGMDYNRLINALFLYIKHHELYKYLIKIYNINCLDDSDPQDDIWAFLYVSLKNDNIYDISGGIISEVLSVEDLKFLVSYFKKININIDIMDFTIWDWEVFDNSNLGTDDIYETFNFLMNEYPSEFSDTEINSNLFEIGLISGTSKLIEYIIDKNIQYDNNFFYKIKYDLNYALKHSYRTDFDLKVFIIIYDFFVEKCNDQNLLLNFRQDIIELIIRYDIYKIFQEILDRSVDLSIDFYVEMINNIIYNHNGYSYIKTHHETVKILLNFLEKHNKVPKDILINFKQKVIDV